MDCSYLQDIVKIDISSDKHLLLGEIIRSSLAKKKHTPGVQKATRSHDPYEWFDGWLLTVIHGEGNLKSTTDKKKGGQQIRDAGT